jgi:colanic acid/amylovoran biosynthesis glycosyltransferase
VLIAPLNRTPSKRSLPESISLTEEMVPRRSQLFMYAFFVAISVTRNTFWRDIHFLRSEKRLSLGRVLDAIKSTATFLYSDYRLRRFLRMRGQVDVIYSYWNHEAAFAAINAKRRKFASVVISRAHGYDLYEEQSKNLFLPLKRQFLNEFDRIFCVSERGMNYLLNRYHARPGTLSKSYLGVALPATLCPPSADRVLRLVSVSYCVGVKRIDKIIQGLALYARKNPDSNIHWTHIGGGPLFDTLRNLANAELGRLSNIRYEFAGLLNHGSVQTFYETSPVDFLINASESEGIPVSIMECMSYGVPAIAPDVGGVRELVSPDCGWLMSSQPTADEVSRALQSLAEQANTNLRASAREKIENTFCAEKQHRHFIEEILSLIRCSDYSDDDQSKPSARLRQCPERATRQ